MIEQNLMVEKYVAAETEKRAAFYPSVNATAQIINANSATNPSMSNAMPEGAGSPRASTNSKLNVTQNLFNGQDSAKLRAAEIETKENRYSLSEARRAQAEGAVIAFFSVLEDQSDLQNHLKELSFNRKKLEETKARIKIGNARPTEAINLEATIAGNLTDITSAKASLEQQRAVFRRLLKISDDQPVDVKYTSLRFNPEKIDSILSGLDIDKRSDLEAKKANSNAQKEYLSAARGARLPSLDFSASYFMTDTEQPSQKGQYTLGLTVTIPFPFGMEKKSQIDQARKTYEIAKRQEQEKLADLERDKSQLVKTLESNIEQLKRLTEAKEIGERNVAALKKDRQIGLSTYTEVLNAFTSYQQTIRKLDRGRFEFEANCYRALIWSVDVGRLTDVFEENLK